MDSKATESYDLTKHDALQRGNSHRSQFVKANDSNDRSRSVPWPNCLTKKQRLAILTAVMIFLAIAFIILIYMVVSHKKKDTTECHSNPCIHGSCKVTEDRFECSCFHGYPGTKCQNEINECSSQPCMHGTCVDGLGKYTCDCFSGFNGTLCEKDIDECISNTCIHGVCIDGANGYNCSCFNGYTGNRCQEDIDECSHEPCKHGICTDHLGAYECECLAGYNGTNCDQESLVTKNIWIGPLANESITRFVNYTLVAGQQTYSNLQTCAVAAFDNWYLAVRANETTGACDALTWDWGSDPQYVAGFAYLRKTKTIYNYHPPLKIKSRFQWLLPGTFGVGGSVDLYISIPQGVSWKAFEIMMVDTTEFSFHTYTGDHEVIMVYIQIERQRNGIASAHFKIWTAGWANKLFLRKTALADGNAHKFTFVPQADEIQILLDDTEVLEYTHPTDPATAKQISIDAYDIPDIDLHNITFVGV